MAVKESKADRAPKKTSKKPAADQPQAAKVKPEERLLRVKLIRSVIGRPQKQREVVKVLGLRKMNSEVLRKDCPEIWGMIRKINHLVKVEVVEKK
jgi:large subunit ribosomal protein L30